MSYHKIIYETTRELHNVEDKLRIATVFIFCEQLGSKRLANFLYSENHKIFIEQLNQEFKEYDVDFSVNFENKNINNAFFKTLEKVKQELDSNGYLKALNDGDPFALVICGIVETNFNWLDFTKKVNNINKQLSLF